MYGAASVFSGPPPSEVIINYAEHPGQAEISDALELNFKSDRPASVVEIIASRGWGKTIYFVCSILIPYLVTHPNAKVMWVAPNYLIAQTPIDDVFKGVNEDTGEKYVPEIDSNGNRIWEFVTTKSGPILKWWNGATVVFRSADAPDSIVSKGFNLIVIDEAAIIEEQVFTQQILGTARKSGIKIFMITSPRGKKHWTHRIFMKGQDAADPYYLSFQQPYTKNPYFSATLTNLIKDIPDWLFRQEYMAEFVDDGQSVLRGLENVLVGPQIDFETAQQEWAMEIKDIEISPATPKKSAVIRRAKDRIFVVGLDLAKQKDYTVITVMDTETGALVYYRRLNKEDYRVVLEDVAEICKRYNQADLIYDATGVGAGLGDMLNNYDVVAHPYVFTNESKVELINRLILSVEYAEITLPNITTMRNELSAYTYTLTRTGKISYNAPAGYHDDIVCSLALANLFRKENAGSEDLATLDAINDINSGRAKRAALEGVIGNKTPDPRRRSVEEMFNDHDDEAEEHL